MTRSSNAASLFLFAITPRFEIFYALQALAETESPEDSFWRKETSRKLSKDLRSRLARLAPSPLVWPLLADSLRSAPPMVQFKGMMEELRTMENGDFQRAVLGGAFKNVESVESLISGEMTLSQTIGAEASSRKQLLSLFGLLPFRKNAPGTRAFDRIVSNPKDYKTELADSLESFWTTMFADTWESMKPQMLNSGDRFEEILANSSLDEFARITRLPLKIEDDSVAAVQGTMRVPLGDVEGIHVIPSAFNRRRFWAAYTDTSSRTRFFIPLLDAALRPMDAGSAEPSLVFGALGDTTRYAIASVIARTPMTSVDLARKFGVSKPTISHHVRILRSARLLDELPGEHGVVLSLNRVALERASGDAATEMFSATGTAPAVRRSRK